MAVIDHIPTTTWETFAPEILWQGEVDAKSIKIVDTNTQFKTDNVPVLDLIDKLYKEKILINTWTNGTLFTLQHFDTNPFTLYLGECSYLDFRATLMKAENKGEATNAIVVSFFVKTSDGHLVFGERTQQTSMNEKSKQIGVIGGTYNKDELENNSLVKNDLSPNAMVKLELHEELGLPIDLIYSNKLVAIARDRVYKRPIMFFEVTVPYTLAEIENSFKANGNKAEHTALLSIEDTSKAVNRLAVSWEFPQLTEALKTAFFIYKDIN